MLSTFFALLRTLLYGWILSLIELYRALRDLCHSKWPNDKDPPKHIHCFPIDHPAVMRPDPLLYSQRALIAQGLAVTYDNPDIQLFKSGVPVSSSPDVILRLRKEFELAAAEATQVAQRQPENQWVVHPALDACAAVVIL